MLTPEEKKYFELLWKLGKSYGRRVIQFEIDLDYDDGELTNEKFKEDDIGGWGVGSIEIPEIASKFLADFYNAKILPKVDNTIQKLGVYDPSGMRLYFVINLELKMIKSWVEIDFYDSGETQYNKIDLSDKQMSQLFSMLGDSYQDYINIDFEGSGDSGYIDNDITLNDGSRVTLPENILDKMYEMLPGGWEINEGSQGTFTINMEEKEISLDYTENIYETVSDTIFELDI